MTTRISYTGHWPLTTEYCSPANQFHFQLFVDTDKMIIILVFVLSQILGASNIILFFFFAISLEKRFRPWILCDSEVDSPIINEELHWHPLLFVATFVFNSIDVCARVMLIALACSCIDSLLSCVAMQSTRRKTHTYYRKVCSVQFARQQIRVRFIEMKTERKKKKFKIRTITTY